ncbi:MAG: M14 family metallocarboxypeptidase [Oscillospiraceae bacterium]|nr:M14 family metallocarboxypeptidase [Oscillospiraceae bacterium]
MYNLRNISLSGNIVPTNVSYNSNILNSNISLLKKIHPFLDVFSIGSSVLGNPLYCIKLGSGDKKVFYSASMHANEWITSPLLMKFIEDFCIAYVNGDNILGHSAKEIFSACSIYIVPMCNPDGVDLVTGLIPPKSSAYLSAKQIADKYPSIPFPSGWKANIEGVDINLQFPAGWEKAKEIKFGQGFVSPAPRDYVGLTPLSTPEAKAIYDFTLMHDFKLILAYHTQGKEIYWQFKDYAPERAKQIGEKLAQISGYALAEVPYTSSFAGYKDWFLQEFRYPGYTIEAGYGENPLPIDQFDEIYRDNLGILVLGAVLS